MFLYVGFDDMFVCLRFIQVSVDLVFLCVWFGDMSFNFKCIYRCLDVCSFCSSGFDALFDPLSAVFC